MATIAPSHHIDDEPPTATSRSQFRIRNSPDDCIPACATAALTLFTRSHSKRESISAWHYSKSKLRWGEWEMGLRKIGSSNSSDSLSRIYRYRYAGLLCAAL